MKMQYGFMDLIPAELDKTLMAMSRTKDPQERKLHSEAVLNLANSLSSLANASQAFDIPLDEPDDFDFGEFDDEFFADDANQDKPVLELHKSNKGKKKRR
ncbi:MAG: hypothetical protein GF398_03935 [Chitinivibrionales bacterium]|nr:hypothetical protein [Chitinivibrionales bacterium]